MFFYRLGSRVTWGSWGSRSMSWARGLRGGHGVLVLCPGLKGYVGAMGFSFYVLGSRVTWGPWGEGDFGRFLRDFDGFVIILARNPDEKCCHGVN